MICQNILRRSSLWDVSTIREIEVRIMRKEKQPDIPGHGFIIKEHHYEYWIDYSVTPGEGMVGLKMPLRYVVEMFMDRIAASKTYQGEAYRNWHPLEYYEKGAARLGKMIHPDTAKLLHELLEMLAEEGEEKTFSYIKHVLLKQKKY